MCAIIGFDSPTLTEQEIRPYFDRTVSRGPDMSRMEKAGRGMARLPPSCHHGPARGGDAALPPRTATWRFATASCTASVRSKRSWRPRATTFASESDCELILPLYREYGVEMFAKLDAEFAMIIYDAKTDRLVAARDPIGIRPLFYGYLADGGILFASEAKNLVGLCEHIMPFPPGHYYADGKFVRYADLTTVDGILQGRSGHCMQKASVRSSSRAWKSGSTPTRRSASCSPAVWIPALSAPSPPSSSARGSAPLPSAWTLTPSTSSTPARSPTSSAPSTPRSS